MTRFYRKSYLYRCLSVFKYFVKLIFFSYHADLEHEKKLTSAFLLVHVVWPLDSEGPFVVGFRLIDGDFDILRRVASRRREYIDSFFVIQCYSYIYRKIKHTNLGNHFSFVVHGIKESQVMGTQCVPARVVL